MTNKLSHFKFTKKENSLNKSVIERKKENDSLKKERKYSELLIRILLSNNKIDKKENNKINNTKRKTLFNNNEFLIKYKNKNKPPKVYNEYNTLNNSQKKYNNKINKYKTEKKNTYLKSSIMNKKLDEFKEIIKHNLNLNLETKFSFLKKNNSSNKERIKYSNLKYIKINKNSKLNIKNSRNKIQNQITRTKTTENINNLKLNNKINKKQNISINKAEKKSKNKLKNKKIVYINLSKNNIARTEKKEMKEGIIKNNKDSVKKNIKLILIDDYEQKKGIKQNNITFYLSPKRLIDQIRTIKKLNIINKSS